VLRFHENVSPIKVNIEVTISAPRPLTWSA